MTARKRWTKWVFSSVPILVIGYVGIYVYLYSMKDQQTKQYRSTALPGDFKFSFSEPTEELIIRSPQGGLLNALLFKKPQAKGVICFWKGGGGTLANWGLIAPRFLQYGYDVLITDYRQHGKSKGPISLANFYSDAQTVYDSLKRRYHEDQIVICGYSLGGRVAAHLASTNHPKFTFLIDPSSAGGDFSDRFTDLLYYPFPSVNGFTFLTDQDVQKAPRPVIVVSTDNPHTTAYQLNAVLDHTDQLLVIPHTDHGSILNHPQTMQLLKKSLAGV